MAERIAPRQFHDSDGVDDWRVLWSVAFAVFRTGDFATGVRLVAEIGRLAEAAGHHPDLTLRAGVLEVRPVTREHWSLTDLDLSLARPKPGWPPHWPPAAPSSTTGSRR